MKSKAPREITLGALLVFIGFFTVDIVIKQIR